MQQKFDLQVIDTCAIAKEKKKVRNNQKFTKKRWRELRIYIVQFICFDCASLANS